MALLTLRDIGKIYVSDGNIAVGIRGVNLSFDRGEFVAVTGKSGSGKSTLLNVISGMDSYEEGELYIDGQSTSHYLQPEWEEYREKYVSFIFQDYNIIESFTVLQNVELALMHIEDKKERRRRAMELIDRVGLSSHAKQKGSKLSGGQKQRTVIARALAKDSPIILADEPTGNLDSATSREIIELLREVSRDKLLIVVTHNFEQVEDYATRHIRVFDGAIESDHAIREYTAPTEKNVEPIVERKKKKHLKNGITLGRTIFAAKPNLSAFLCLLMIVGTLGIFLVTSFCGSAGNMFKPQYMFNHIDGRLVLTTQSGEVLSEEQVKQIAEEYGAKDYLRFDALLDNGDSRWVELSAGGESEDVWLNSVYGKDYGKGITGRYPEAKDEVFLYLPISCQPIVGDGTLEVTEITMDNATFKVTGVKYYYDNNLKPECLFTEEGFRTATALHYLVEQASSKIALNVRANDGSVQQTISLGRIIPSFDMAEDRIYVACEDYNRLLGGGKKYTTTVTYTSEYYNYNFYYGGKTDSYVFERVFTDRDITAVRPDINGGLAENALYISDELICEMAEEVLGKSYKQVSLFFENDKASHAAAEKLQDAGYIAVPSDTTYEPDATEAILSIISCLFMAAVWLLTIVFLAFFINLCSSRALGAFKGDMAIMRSMGIPVKVIRIGMYVRMLLSLIPAFILVVLTALIIFTTPALNKHFLYLYAWQYALIFLGMLALTVRITHKQIRKLFGESVKKSLKGGNDA